MDEPGKKNVFRKIAHVFLYTTLAVGAGALFADRAGRAIDSHSQLVGKAEAERKAREVILREYDTNTNGFLDGMEMVYYDRDYTFPRFRLPRENIN